MTLTDPFTPPAEPLDPTDPIFPFLASPPAKTTQGHRVLRWTIDDAEDLRDWGRCDDPEIELGLYERYIGL